MGDLFVDFKKNKPCSEIGRDEESFFPYRPVTSGYLDEINRFAKPISAGTVPLRRTY
jgi:hypothetical protein